CALPPDAHLNQDHCEWQGDECTREIAGAHNGASCRSTDQLVMWGNQFSNPSGCAQHTLDELTVGAGILIPSGTTLAETQQTNFLECTYAPPPSPPKCNATSLAELVRPAGFSPGQSGYYPKLDVRW